MNTKKENNSWIIKIFTSKDEKKLKILAYSCKKGQL